ncbi:MAG: FUSC family protein, partial [Mycobacteriaceae bacterium]|nr:FUSC family protein [Mycobacteriaceae bacterium]
RLWATLLAAQRVTALLSATADDRRNEPADARTRAAMDAMLQVVATFASDLASNAVMPRSTPDCDALDAAARHVKQSVPSPDGLTGAPLHLALVAAARARTAARLRLRLHEGADALDLPDPPAVHVPHPRDDEWRSQVAATLSWRSTALRHGVRLGAACGISMGVFTALGPSGIFGITHGSWVTITLMVVLRPTLGDSLQSVLQRAVGTAIGGMVAVAMLAALPLEWSLSIGLIVVGALAALLKPVNALWYVVLFTPIPLVFAASTGRSGTDILVERLIATGVACAAGLLIAAVIWPTRGGMQMPRAMAQALRTDARDLDAMIGIVIGEPRVSTRGPRTRRPTSPRHSTRPGNCCSAARPGAHPTCIWLQPSTRLTASCMPSSGWPMMPPCGPHRSPTAAVASGRGSPPCRAKSPRRDSLRGRR